MKNKILLCVCSLILGSGVLDAQTKIIAHRGFWDTEGSAQNSITALDKAYEAGVYGSEFDVLMTKDGVLVVNHDNVYKGFDIQDHNYKDIKHLKLPNGETLPTLEDYLKRGKEYPKLQLILELKPLKTPEAENKAAAKIVKMVKDLELESQVEYISFSLNICKEFARLNPNAQVASLSSNTSPADVHKLNCTGVDYHHSVLLTKNPEWLSEAEILGLTINVWTINTEDLMNQFIEKDVDYITTDKPLLLKKILEEREAE